MVSGGPFYSIGRIIRSRQGAGKKALRTRKKAVSSAFIVLGAVFFLLTAGQASAAGGAEVIKTENPRLSSYTGPAPGGREPEIDPKLLRRAYRNRLFCIPEAGNTGGVFHGYMWVVIVLHVSVGAALALILAGNHLKSFFNLLIPRRGN